MAKRAGRQIQIRVKSILYLAF